MMQKRKTGSGNNLKTQVIGKTIMTMEQLGKEALGVLAATNGKNTDSQLRAYLEYVVMTADGRVCQVVDVADGLLVLDDGGKFPADECLVVERYDSPFRIRGIAIELGLPLAVIEVMPGYVKAKFNMLADSQPHPLTPSPVDGDGDGERNAELLAENETLKLKLTAALEQGAMDNLKAQRVAKLEAELEALKAAPVGALPCTPTEGGETPRWIEFNTLIMSLDPWSFSDADTSLANLVNAGWSIAHEAVNSYYHPSTDSTCHYRIVRLERWIDVVPSAPNPLQTYADALVEENLSPDPSPLASVRSSHDYREGSETPIIMEPEAVPSMLEKMAEGKPIFAAVMKHGAGAVIEAMDAKVKIEFQQAVNGYGEGLDALLLQPPTRFQSLLTAGQVTPDEFSPESELAKAVLP